MPGGELMTKDRISLSRIPFATLLTTCLVGSSTLLARSPEGPLPEEILAAAHHSRAVLRKGSYRAEGYVDRSHERIYPVEGKVQLRCAFDFDRNLLRFDSSRPMWKVPPEGDQASATLARQESRFILTEDKFINWTDDMPRALIRLPSAESGKGSGCFDVRLVALFNWGTLEMPGATYEAMQFKINRKPQDVQKEADGTYRVSWATDRSRKDIWFDPGTGMSPVRLEYRWSDNLSGERPSEISTVSWRQQNDVWVPGSVSHEVLRTPARRLDLEIEWESVNEELDPSLCELAGLELPKLDALDLRFGPPVRIAGTGARRIRTASEERPASAPRQSSWVGALIAINVVLLLSLLMLAVWRTRPKG